MKHLSAKRKERAVLEFRKNGCGRRSAEIIANKYDCCGASLYNWHNQYDGTLQSLKYKVNPNRYIWNKYSEQEMNTVKEVTELYPCGRLEAFGRLQVERGFTKSIRTLYRMLRVLNVAPPQDLAKYIPEPYKTPNMLGVKWQVDVKYVPAICLREIPKSAYYFRDGYRLYQYTCVDEATRKRFIYAYDSYGKKETIDFLKRCIVFFGCKPLIIQTDNGGEFTNVNLVVRNEHIVTKWLRKQKIEHQLIRPATPRHNGKVERSHRTDNREFYFYHQFGNGFTSLEHLRTEIKDWCYRYNNVRVMSVHNYKTPARVEQDLLDKLRQDNCQTVYLAFAPKDPNNEKRKLIERQDTIRLVTQNTNWAFTSRPLADIPDIA